MAVFLPIESAPFGLVGLKHGSGNRRILRRFPVHAGRHTGPPVVARFYARSCGPAGATLAVSRPWVDSPSGRPRPTGASRIFRAWVGELLGAPAGGILRGYPHPSRLRCATFPLEGGRLGGRTMCAPTVGDRPVSLAKKTQAQTENRSDSKFCTPRPLVGPDSNAGKHSWFCAPGLLQHLSGGGPVNGGPGGRLPLSRGDGPKGQRG